MTVYWRPHHEIYLELPPEQDFIALDEETEQSIGRVCLMPHSEQAGRRDPDDLDTARGSVMIEATVEET